MLLKSNMVLFLVYLEDLHLQFCNLCRQFFQIIKFYLTIIMEINLIIGEENTLIQ